MNASEIETGHQPVSDQMNLAQEGGLFLRYFNRIAAKQCHKLLRKMDAGILLGQIEGSLPDGSRKMLGGRAAGPVAEMNIRDWRALLRIGWSGSIGLYEGWAKGEWDSPDPVQIFALFMLNRTTLGDSARASSFARYAAKALHWSRRNSKAGSKRNIEFHYDLGNDFYAAWLDEGMAYSSAMFDAAAKGEQSLSDAQAAKNRALLSRLNLNDGDSLLEIGCGWGGLGEAALRQAQISYHGITLSHEQKAYADQRLSGAGFAAQAKVSITDYRDVTGQYDAIASVEMVEAVGQEYWPSYLDCIARNLKPGGKAGVQFIAIADDIFPSYSTGVDFIQRYIFPGGMLISQSRFKALAQERGLSWDDQVDFGLDYAETLHRWRVAFEDAAAKGRLPKGFDKKFIGLWRFYLMYCEGGFRGRGIEVTQVTLQKL
jgi:cyclopropane-fatty-acyl-phospholipid synthase